MRYLTQVFYGAVLLCGVFLFGCSGSSTLGVTTLPPSLSEGDGVFSLQLSSRGMWDTDTTIGADKSIAYLCGYRRQAAEQKFKKSATLSDEDFSAVKNAVETAQLLTRESLGDDACAQQIADGATLLVEVKSGDLSRSLSLSNYAPDWCDVPAEVQSVVSVVSELRRKYLGDEAAGICPAIDLQ